MSWVPAWRQIKPTRQAAHGALSRLSWLLSAGLDLQRSLTLVAADADPRTARALASVQQRLELGQAFSQALSDAGLIHRRAAALLAIAEETGQISERLQDCLSAQTRQADLTRQLLQAVRYPLGVLAVALLMCGYLLMEIVPSFVTLYDSLGAELPLMTQRLLAVSQALQQGGLWGLLLATGLGIGLHQVHRQHPSTQRGVQWLLWYLPGLSAPLRQYWWQRWHDTLGMTLRAGLPYLSALQAATEAVEGSPLADDQAALQQAVASGTPLSEALKQAPHFPPDSAVLVAVGEQTGQLASLLSTLGQRHQATLDELIRQRLRWVEPLLMALIGGLVGLIVLSLYLPLFQLGQAL